MATSVGSFGNDCAVKRYIVLCARRNRVLKQLKKEPFPMSLEYLEDIASVACVQREGEPTLQQMLKDHPDVKLDGDVDGNVVPSRV